MRDEEPDFGAFQSLRYDLSENFVTITLDRPKTLNAFNAALLSEFNAALDAADADDRVKAVIVTGAGRAFSSGADLSAGPTSFEPSGDTHGLLTREAREQHARTITRSYFSLKPIICAVNGPAMGIGCTLTLPMDIRIASTTARFGFVFTRRGIVPEAGSGWLLPRLVGIPTALEWCLEGRTVSAEEAFQRGLVRSLHAPEDLLAAAQALAREIAEASPVSVALTRQMLWRGLMTPDPLVAIEIENRAMRSRGKSDDVREGIAAYLERRKPAFPDTVSRNLPDVFANDGVG